ncbi:dihydropyrimidinase, partial [Streptomyces boluensis]
MSTRTLIRGGLVITATDEIHADVLIEDGRIAALAAHGSEPAMSWTADRVIDATDKYVIPGGVDAHTHMELPFGGTFASDTFETGTRAAAWGGTTTIVDFAVQSQGRALREGLDAWYAKADGNCAIDYGFHMILSDVNDASLKEMDLLVEEGITSFKLFMAYPGVFYSDDGQVLRAMQRSAGNGGLIMMHAENGIAIDVLVEQALQRGETDPRYHGEVRKVLLEAEATHRAIQLARVAGAPLYVVHVSAEEAVAELAAARDKGLPVFGETCPQYLFLSTDNLAEPDFEGAKYVCSTPLRPREHQAALWRGLRTNDLQVVSTDHCPFCFTGQKELGRENFSKIPNGLPGVENRMDLLHQAVVDGHITRRRWIEIACAAPARMFGLYGKKGTLAPGADADVVIYDPAATQTISAETHHMNVDYSAYEGKQVTGRVETVLSRGEVVIEEREFKGRA